MWEDQNEKKCQRWLNQFTKRKLKKKKNKTKKEQTLKKYSGERKGKEKS